MKSQLSPKQTKIIKSIAPVLQEHGKTITRLFYSNLLYEHPELNNVFNRTNQDTFHQAASLASVVHAYAANIDRLELLTAALEKINHKHASLFIQPGHYDVVGQYLTQAIAEVLGDGLTPGIADAWKVAYRQLASIMVGREKELMDNGHEDWNKWRDFKIVAKIPESSEITSFHLQPVQQILTKATPLNGEESASASLPIYLPGQYISVKVNVPELGYHQPRQYSLSDTYKDDTYRISVKKETGLNLYDSKGAAHPGLVSNILHNRKDVGDIIQISPPFGEFHLKHTGNNPIVLLAAGVGITPMMSMLNTLCKEEPLQPITFIHGARTVETRAFYKDIKRLAKRNENVKYASFISSPNASVDGHGRDFDFEGRVRLSMLDADEWLFIDNAATEYYICGPESFMKDLEADLVARGVEQSRIHMELFSTTVI